MKIFISSDLETDSPILLWAHENGHEVNAKSLITFEACDFQLPTDIDVIFFYSKNGVKYFIEGLDMLQMQSISLCEFGSIGEATAKEIKTRFSKPVTYQFDEYKDNIDQLNTLLSGKKCLFPQAATSRKTIEKTLTACTTCTTIPLVVYTNIPDTTFTVEDVPDIIAFTSPLNVDAFFAQNKKDKHQQIISIGKTTANHLLQQYQLTSFVAQQPSEAGILDVILSIM